MKSHDWNSLVFSFIFILFIIPPVYNDIVNNKNLKPKKVQSIDINDVHLDKEILNTHLQELIIMIQHEGFVIELDMVEEYGGRSKIQLQTGQDLLRVTDKKEE